MGLGSNRLTYWSYRLSPVSLNGLAVRASEPGGNDRSILFIAAIIFKAWRMPRLTFPFPRINATLRKDDGGQSEAKYTMQRFPSVSSFVLPTGINTPF